MDKSDITTVEDININDTHETEEELGNTKNDAVAEDEADAKLFGELFLAHDKHKHKHDGLAKGEETEEERLIRLVRIDEEDTYPFDGKRRGMCLIFENDMFHTDLGLSKRKGSNVDRTLMIDTFTRLQFDVRVFQNLTTSELLDTLDRYRYEDHSHADMFAVVVLSHGNEGILYGYDKAYPVHKIWEPFTADNCEDLAGKPKLFFIQACQGSQLDHGVTVADRAAAGRTQTDGFASYRTPLHADFLIAHSTVTGFYSWRNTVQGSWFIQVLGISLLVNSSKHDILTILTKVARVIAREYESNSSNKEFNQKKQIPFVYSTLTNRLLLNQK